MKQVQFVSLSLQFLVSVWLKTAQKLRTEEVLTALSTVLLSRAISSHVSKDHSALILRVQ
jgi:hypothetical protein